MAEAPGDEAESNQVEDPEVDGGDEELVAETLAYLARSIVDHPEDVRVSLSHDEPRTVIQLQVNPEDAARVIGRGGRVARALRAITKAAAALEDIPVHVQIGEPRQK
ncbi:MAG: KH domain-containing protein [Actinomycetota bacterium]